MPAGRSFRKEASMETSLPSSTNSDPLTDLSLGQQLRGFRRTVTVWSPLGLLVVAVAYASAGLLLRPEGLGFNPLFRAAVYPVGLFAIGLVPMLATTLIVWLSRHSLSPAERRSRLLGAAMSTALFLPALLLARSFG
jgi:hypothetical protein